MKKKMPLADNFYEPDQSQFLSEKDKNKLEDALDLSDLKEFSFSNIMRELNKKASKKQVIEFLEIYKKYFDKCTKEKTKNGDKVALKLAFKG